MNELFALCDRLGLVASFTRTQPNEKYGERFRWHVAIGSDIRIESQYSRDGEVPYALAETQERAAEALLAKLRAGKCFRLTSELVNKRVPVEVEA